MSEELDEFIRKNTIWPQLPNHLKRILGESQQKYEQYVFEFSLKNQLRFRGSLVRQYKKDEKKYYECLIQASIQRLMLFPYHLADVVVKGLRITPFIYYKEVVVLLIENEKSYDTMPNFTAADCLRLLGIGRNEYLDLVSKSRGIKKNKARSIRSLLPRVPIDIPMLPWWRVELGCVLEEDVKCLNSEEIAIIDLLIDCESQTAGSLNYDIIKSLYKRGLIYLDVPITAADRASVPPLKGFVMNRTAGDYFETLLYKIFVSIDEHTTVGELAHMLQVDVEHVKQAVSLYCRLGFARKINPGPVGSLNRSWDHALTETNATPYHQINPLNFTSNPVDMNPNEDSASVISSRENTPEHFMENKGESNSTNGVGKRVALLFDATLAAYLMMGNLSPDLKSHAVTLFEVGKLCDESLDGLMKELDKVGGETLEGEAWRYLCAARCVRQILATLRPKLQPVDLLRAESLLALPSHARTRLLETKYRLAVSVAPMSMCGALGLGIPQLAPPHQLLSEPWFRLYLYHVAGYGPPSLFLTKGTVIRSMPRVLLGYSRLSAFGIGAESLPAPAALNAVKSAIQRRSVLIQAASVRGQGEKKYLPFPPPDPGLRPLSTSEREDYKLWMSHAGLRRLARRLRLHRCCGYVTLADLGLPDYGCNDPPDEVQLGAHKKKLPGSAMLIKDRSQGVDDDLPISMDPRLRSPNESHFAVTPNKEPSASNSPSNGFTSSDCDIILKEELECIGDSSQDRLNEDDSTLNTGSYEIINKVESIDDRSDSSKRSDYSMENLVASDCDANGGRGSGTTSSQEKDLSDLLSPLDESISMFTKLNERLNKVSIVTEGDSGVDVNNDEDSCKPEQWTILDVNFGIPLFDEELCARVCEAIVERLITPENVEQLKKDNEYLCEDITRFVTQCQYYPGETRRAKGGLPTSPRRCLVFENGRVKEWSGK